MNMATPIQLPRGDEVHVLVVDDMEANLSLLARRLEKLGFITSLADSGVAALTMLATVQPDVILLDYMMPQMNGIEVLHKLRGNPATRDIPVIMVTARAEGDAVREALAAGADDYVTKPIDFDALRARMNTQLSRRCKSSDLQRAALVLDERVTLRSMALADLEGELQEETRRRLALEAQISGSEPMVPSNTRELALLLDQIQRSFETVFSAAMAGKPLNPAQAFDIKEMLTRACAMVEAR